MEVAYKPDLVPSPANALSLRFKLASGFLALGLLLIPFDDLGGPFDVAGGLSRSPAWIAICAAGLLLPKPIGKCRTVEKRLVQLWFFGAFITIASLPFLPEVSKGETLLDKGIRVAIILTAYLGTIASAMRAYQHIPKQFRLFSIVGTVLFFLYAIFSYVVPNALESLDLLHATPNFAMRQRATRFEAASLGAGLLLCVAITVIWLRKRLALLVIVASLPIILELTQSRGTAVAALATGVTALLVFLLSQQVVRSKLFVNALATMTIGCSIAFAFMLQHLVTSEAWRGMSKAVSDATRSIWADSALEGLLQFPLGMGYAGPTYWMQNIFSTSLLHASALFPIADLSEAVNLVRTSQSDAFSPKTMLALAGMYFGVPGVIILTTCLWQTMRSWVSSKSSTMLGFLPACVLFIFVTSSYFSSPFSWEQPLLLGMLIAVAKSFKE